MMEGAQAGSCGIFALDRGTWRTVEALLCVGLERHTYK